MKSFTIGVRVVVLFSLFTVRSGLAQTNVGPEQPVPHSASSANVAPGASVEPVHSQPNAPLAPSVTVGSQSKHANFLTDWEFVLSCEILFFGVIAMVFLYALLRARNAMPDDILRSLAVVLIIIGSLFCMTAGFSSTQIAPVIGLFGTIIGYIIGKRSDTELAKDAQTKAPVAEDAAK